MRQKLYRYMVGDIYAGGCVLASSVEDAIAKVRAFYREMMKQDVDCDYEDTRITAWDYGEGFLEECPDVVEVYP